MKYLEPNFGRVIYHEDIILILEHYTGWDLGRCNALRRAFFQNQFTQEPDWQELQEIAPRKVVDFVKEESRWSFCKPHAIAFSQFTKKTAVLKSLHRDVYLTEINKFEQRHGYTWDDIGIRLKGVSILQS